MKIIKGQKYIVRSVEAGVFYGEITDKDGSEVTMKDARCLWYWNGAASLNQLASEGVKNPNQSKFTVPAKEIVIIGVCEIIPCEAASIESIESVEEWKR